MWESEQFISFGIDESQIAHQIIRDNPDTPDTADAVMCAASEDVINEFQNVLKEAGLNPKIVQIEIEENRV